MEHAQLAGSWNVSHRDPFDRMLAAQAKLEKIYCPICGNKMKTGVCESCGYLNPDEVDLDYKNPLD